MKKIFLLVATAALLMACGGAKVKVTNPLKLDRTNETVEISWQEVQAKVSDATPENIVVIAPDGSQQPSQVLYNGGTEPQALIFQATVAGNSSATYTLETGQREAYPAQAFGRYVPERMDDFAWENNLIAHRMYGPALEATGEISNGIDIWLKRTDSLIIDKWFKPGYNYHSDQGEGLDCYKVGRTLGAGAMAPYEKDSLWLGNNYIRYKVLDNGPIRIAFQLDYAPFLVDSVEVTERRTISLDANQRFNRMDNLYEGDFTELPIAAGFVRHDVKRVMNGDDWMGMCEATSDTKDPVRDGDIYLGVILPGGEMIADTLGHAVAVKSVKSGETLTYYAGSGWSQGGVENMGEWVEEITAAQAAATRPLTVTVRK